MAPTVLVMIDGLRPDAISNTNSPHLHDLLAQSAYTLQATSIMPSITLPCHMSIFHSVPPGRHGITTNDWQPMARPLPGLVDHAYAAGKRSAFFYNWEPLRNLSLAGSLQFSYFRDNVYTDLVNGDLVIAGEVARYLSSDQPDFVFVYFGTVDTVGHLAGWMSTDYLIQVKRVDGALGTLLSALPGDSTILIQSDHGGHERTHGSELPEDMTIPWVVSGPTIHRGHILQAPVNLLDTAPTLARLLGLAPHPAWEGQCVEEIFV
jgi:predicted AlkP superfamily pyrophosphatase or phosphodiesterase